MLVHGQIQKSSYEAKVNHIWAIERNLLERALELRHLEGPVSAGTDPLPMATQVVASLLGSQVALVVVEVVLAVVHCLAEALEDLWELVLALCSLAEAVATNCRWDIRRYTLKA